MLRKMLAISFVVVLASPVFALGETSETHGNLSAAEIVNKNIEVRGGLQAWRAVQTISESGKLGAGGDQRGIPTQSLTPPAGHGKAQSLPSSPRLKEEAQLPFVMELARPRRMRLELQFEGKTAVQVYDGANGWKLRPYLNRLEVEPYTDEELSRASTQSDLDGPLVDYAAKGTRIELAGMEKVEDRDTYNLKLTMKNGQTMHVWVDVQTFLEAKVEGQPRRLDGKLHPVEVYYRDYRSVDGLKIPFLLETRVLSVDEPGQKVRAVAYPAEKIVIEKVVVNPRLDASLFSKPQVEMATMHK